MRTTPIWLLAALVASAGCSEPPPAPTREIVLVLPATGGLPDTQRLQTRTAWLDLVGQRAAVGTWLTVLDSETLNVIAQLQVTGGARSYRLYGPASRDAVKRVLEVLEPERAASAPVVAYKSLPAALLSCRKTDLPLRVVVIGSVCPGSMGFGTVVTPCDREIARPDGPFSQAAMGDFPERTTLGLVPPRQDWGASAAYRLRGINFWRLLVAARGGQLLRITPDVTAALDATAPQWPNPARASDECDEPGPPAAATTTAKPVAGRAETFSPDRLKGEFSGVALLIDTSGSMGWRAKGEPLPGVMPAVRRHAAQLVRTLPCERFAVIGFGGKQGNQPELQRYPWALGPYLREATPEAREAAGAFIETLEPSGGTPTLPALRAAAGLAGVDTVCLYTDGRPSLEGTPDQILEYAAELRDAGVVVNVIGCGVLAGEGADYDAETFLKTLARKTLGDYSLLATPVTQP